MLNESQRSVFRMIADNKVMVSCLKEYFELKFTEQVKTEGLTNEQIGAIARAQYEGLKKILESFAEIEACKTIEDKVWHINPAR